MKETEELKEEEKLNKKQEDQKPSKNAKHKAKPSIGDIIFRVLILVIIFLIVIVTYVFYLHQITSNETLKNTDNASISTPIKELK